MGVELSPETLLYLAGGGLVLVGVLSIVPVALKTAQAWLADDPIQTVTPLDPISAHNSDEQAPCGFCAHVMTILAACPAADSELQIEYLRAGDTEADVLRQEVCRLTPAQVDA